MLGPVMMSMRRSASSARSLGTNAPCEKRSTTGWRPPSIVRRASAVSSGGVHSSTQARHVAHALEVAAHGVESAGLDQGADRVVALAQQRVSGQWAVEPASQLPRADGGGAAVDHREQRRVLTPAETRIELEIAAGGG